MEEEDLPPWVKREQAEKLKQEMGGDLPFGVYLLLSAVVAIAAVGSVFEYMNQNPVFGVVQSSSPLYVPILGLFTFAGFPLSGFLFFKAVASANKLAEEMDRIDGV